MSQEKNTVASDDRNMTKEEVLRRHGELGSFIVKVQHMQNGTWQGKLTWIEEGQTMNFRSVWEMIKLMENALLDEPEDSRSVEWK